MPSPIPALRAFFVALLCVTAVSATTVVAPTFPELVAEAQTIVRARVTSVESRWVATPQGRIIKTFVTVAVLRTLKGNADATLTLELLGGEVDGEGMRVQGMPRFTVSTTSPISGGLPYAVLRNLKCSPTKLRGFGSIASAAGPSPSPRSP